MSKERLERVDRYCTCGAGLEGYVNAGAASVFGKVWEAEHSGAGHSSATREEAAAKYRALHGGEEPITREWHVDEPQVGPQF